MNCPWYGWQEAYYCNHYVNKLQIQGLKVYLGNWIKEPEEQKHESQYLIQAETWWDIQNFLRNTLHKSTQPLNPFCTNAVSTATMMMWEEERRHISENDIL